MNFNAPYGVRPSGIYRPFRSRVNQSEGRREERSRGFRCRFRAGFRRHSKVPVVDHAPAADVSKVPPRLLARCASRPAYVPRIGEPLPFDNRVARRALPEKKHVNSIKTFVRRVVVFLDITAVALSSLTRPLESRASRAQWKFLLSLPLPPPQSRYRDPLKSINL